MTPIQQHEAELRAMVERAGLKAWKRGGHRAMFASPNGDCGEPYAVRVSASGYAQDREWCHASYAPADDPAVTTAEASHPDPRIALRHCLEMAGLLVDRPPVTDEELVRWLTERAGPCDFMDRWSYGGYTIRRLDSVWVFWHTNRPLERSIYARELGAILWCGERWVEVSK